MTAIADLQTAWETEIAKISDTLLNAEATYALSEYIDARTNQAALSANEIQSYTIAGRTFTRRDVEAGQGQVNRIENKLRALVYGSITMIDLNTTAGQP